MPELEFTTPWFETNSKGIWDQLFAQISPAKILEVGSFEGAAICYLINRLKSLPALEIHCVDTWEGGIEHKPGGNAEVDMRSVESRFDANTNIALRAAGNQVNLHKHKGLSDLCLARLLTAGHGSSFDFIYIDGSHQAPDVLCDAVLGFRLLKPAGVMAFDDYLWAENLPHGIDPLRCPKPAIDAFTNLYCRKLRILTTLNHQLYLQKISD